MIMKSIVLLTNILSPYRHAFYNEMHLVAQSMGIKFRVLLMLDTETDRKWYYEDLRTDFTILLKKKKIMFENKYLFSNPDLKKWLNELAPDVLILGGGYTYKTFWDGLIWGKINKKKTKIVFWSESHKDEGGENSFGKRIVREILRKIIYSSVCYYWVPGSRAKKMVCSYTSRAQFVHVPNLIDNNTFVEIERSLCLGEKTYDKKGKIILFSPIRLIPVKGIDKFLGMMADYPGKSRFRFVVAGDGELREKIEFIAKENEIDLQMLGYQNQESVIKNMVKADFVFIPSISDASPLACIEALWLGKPLLLSEFVGNWPEVIDDNNTNGFIFKYGSRQGIYDILDKICMLNSEWYSLAEATSRKIAQEHFSICDETNRILRDTVQMFD